MTEIRLSALDNVEVRARATSTYTLAMVTNRLHVLSHSDQTDEVKREVMYLLDLKARKFDSKK